MYEQISRNNRDSWLLVMAVTLLLAALGYAIAGAEGFPWEVGVGVAVLTAMLACAVAYFGGRGMVLTVADAEPITKGDNPRLFNVVEEMAIAAGLPVPKVYVIVDSAPNAFATGRSPETAVIAVTTGLLDKLDRDELQGVIAHEMAHIKNYDIRLLMLLAVLVGGIVLISDLYWRANRLGRRRRDSGSGQGQVIFLLVALALALLAPLFARMLELAVSRRREYLADASAALITRYPAGLASALEKIAADPDPLESANRATQHLYIVNPLKGLSDPGSRLFSTHPDIGDRIRRLREMALTGGEPEARPTAGGGYARMEPASLAGAPSGRPPAAANLVAEAPAPPAAPIVAAAVAAPPTPAEQGLCPRCRASLLQGSIQGRKAAGCRQCGGVWLGQKDTEDLLREDPDGLDAADRRFPNLVGHGWSLVGDCACPVCAAPLEPYTPEKPVRVPLDRCPNGHGLWFDDGELSALAWAAKRKA